MTEREKILESFRTLAEATKASANVYGINKFLSKEDYAQGVIDKFYILERCLYIKNLVGVIYRSEDRDSVTEISQELLNDIKILVINGHKFKKEIALRPTYEGDGYDENGEIIYDTAYCPTCNHDFEYEINDWGCAYCCDCGQKLDWSIEIRGEEVKL